MEINNFWNNFKKVLKEDSSIFFSSDTWVGSLIDSASYGITYIAVQYLAEAETKRNEELSIKNEIESQKIIISRLKEDLIFVQNISKEKEAKIKVLNHELNDKKDEVNKLKETTIKLLKTKKEIQEKLKEIEAKLVKLESEKIGDNTKDSDKLNFLLARAHNLVQSSKIQEAVNLVLESISLESKDTKDKHIELTLLLSRLNSIYEHHRKGLLSYSEYSLIENNIVYSFLGMIYFLENKELK